MNTKTKVNVAPSSDEGHFITGARNVIELDNKVTESFLIEGKSELVTKNHTTLKQDEDCLISCQQVYNPFSKMMERAKD
tara:strand:- start:159 stop:395 length:237 start_codon:yes stop_codon:yes gene_type:complete